MNFSCPKCGRMVQPSWACHITAYCVRRLDLPYFLCGDCRLLHVDKALIRTIVSEWRKNSRFAKKVPSKKIYREARDYMETVASCLSKIGYKKKKFKQGRL